VGTIGTKIVNQPQAITTPSTEGAHQGAKHKSKAADKEEQRNAALEAEPGSGKDKKDKKKSQPLKDANGNDLKRPLSAYMLYNNYRRPVLRSEHPGKWPFRNSTPSRTLSHLTLELSLPDLSKLIGEEWKKLNDS